MGQSEALRHGRGKDVESLEGEKVESLDGEKAEGKETREEDVHISEK